MTIITVVQTCNLTIQTSKAPLEITGVFRRVVERGVASGTKGGSKLKREIGAPVKSGVV